MWGSGGGLGFLTPKLIRSTGGTISTPGDGYRYHIFDYGTTDNFVLVSGTTPIQICVQAAGGGGGGGTPLGNQNGNSPGGSGGGGGGTVAADVTYLTPDTYPISVGERGIAAGEISNVPFPQTAGENSTFTLPYGSIGAGGGSVGLSGNGGNLPPSGPSAANSSPAAPNPNVSLTTNILGNGGGPNGSSPGTAGGAGGASGGVNTNGWWKPYQEGGAGGTPGSHGGASSGNEAGPGGNYGGGGGGGGGSFDDSGGYASGGAPGAHGRIIIRYQY